LADELDISHTTVYRKCLEALKELPHCADITRKYCNRFSGYLLVDGKFIKVRGYDSKIPVIYGIDYLTHDIPTYILSVAENYQSCRSFFTSLRLLNYPLQALICDDNVNIYQSCLSIYPKTAVQLCQNHYKENIRNRLAVRTDDTYRYFMSKIQYLFTKRRTIIEFNKVASDILKEFSNDPLCVSIMVDINNRKEYLLGHLIEKPVPRTTNLIESYNSHLNGRLKTIKGFESFSHADLWINGYLVRRRFKKFNDCEGKFKKLNGKCSIELSVSKNVNYENLFPQIFKC
jgi:transposase-like protein